MQDWIRASARWGGRDIEFALIIQSLGRQNEQLALEEERYWKLSEDERTQPTEIPTLDNIFGLSRLWVFGCFELIRTLHEFIKAIDKSSDTVKELGELKKKVSKLRAPLAKLRKSGKKERLFAQPAINPTTGRIGWVVEDGHFITRQELAEETLKALLGQHK